MRRQSSLINESGQLPTSNMIMQQGNLEYLNLSSRNDNKLSWNALSPEKKGPVVDQYLT